MLRRSKSNHDDESTVLGHANSERRVERSAVETRRQFGKTAALGIAGIGLTGTQCVRHRPPPTLRLWALARTQLPGTTIWS